MTIFEFGEKAVACLLELGSEKPSILIDVNMLRVTSRLFNFKWAKPDLSDKEQLKYTKSFLEEHLQKTHFYFKKFIHYYLYTVKIYVIVE